MMKTIANSSLINEMALAAHEFNKKKREKELAAEFNRGYVIACLNSFNLHGDGVISSETFNQLGISKAEIEAMDLSEYDASALAELEKNYPIFYKEDD